MSSAKFTVDRNSEFRRQGTITVEILPTIPPQTVTIGQFTQILLPLTPQAALAPFGNEVFVEMSVVRNGMAGTNGWVPLGLYQIGTCVTQDTGINMVLTLDLFDRAWAVAQRGLLTAYTLPAAGGDLQSELQALLANAWGSVPPWTYSIQPNPGFSVAPGTYNQGQDPWQAALDIFAAAGYELFFDVMGNVVGRPVPDPTQQPVVWNFVEGAISATGQSGHPLGGTPFTTPVDCTMTLTRDGIPNDFFVSATAADGSVPQQSEAADMNPQSPTYIHGPMGDVPSFIYDGNITTLNEAQAEADYNLAVSIAKSWQVSVRTPPNPLFDIDDVCTISRARLGLNMQKFVVDSITTTVRYDDDTAVAGRIFS